MLVEHKINVAKIRSFCELYVKFFVLGNVRLFNICCMLEALPIRKCLFIKRHIVKDPLKYNVTYNKKLTKVFFRIDCNESIELILSTILVVWLLIRNIFKKYINIYSGKHENSDKIKTSLIIRTSSL